MYAIRSYYGKYGVVLLIIAALGANYLIGNRPDVEYGIAVAQSNYKDVIVNENTGICSYTGIGSSGSDSPDIPASFKKVAGNDKLELYLEEATVALAVKSYNFV